MEETEQSAITEKSPRFPLIWPPSDRTRNAARKRLIETLSSTSFLSKRYGTLSHEEAAEVTKIVEEKAFEMTVKAASADDDGIEILQDYCKEMSRRTLDKVKARSGDMEAKIQGEKTDQSVADDE